MDCFWKKDKRLLDSGTEIMDSVNVRRAINNTSSGKDKNELTRIVNNNSNNIGHRPLQRVSANSILVPHNGESVVLEERSFSELTLSKADHQQEKKCGESDGRQEKTLEKKVLRRLCDETVIPHSPIQPDKSLFLNDPTDTTDTSTTKVQKKRVTYADESTKDKTFNETASIKQPNLCSGFYDRLGHLNDILEEDEDQCWSQCEKACVKSPLILKGEYYVRTQCDKICCSITGIAMLSDGRLVITDESNCNIKVISTTGDCLSHFDMPSEPWDVDCSGPNEVVVTFPKEKCIRIISIDKKTSTITFQKVIVTKNMCYGVKSIDSEIYVALENEIQVINFSGEVKARLRKDTSEKGLRASLRLRNNLFSGCKSLTVDKRSDCQTVVFVSDFLKRCVVGVDKRGRKVCQHRASEESSMLGLCMGPEHKVLVCRSPGTLSLLTVDEHGTRVRDLLDLDDIQTVYYSHLDEKIWVARNNNNFVSVYSLKPDYVL